MMAAVAVAACSEEVSVCASARCYRDWLERELSSGRSPPSSSSAPSIQGWARISSRVGRSSGRYDRHQRIRDWHSAGRGGEPTSDGLRTERR